MVAGGGDGLDTVSGGAGADYFYDTSGDAFAETLIGGADSDTYFVDWIPGTSVADSVSDFAVGTGGDIIDVGRFIDLSDIAGDPFAGAISGFCRTVRIRTCSSIATGQQAEATGLMC